MFRRFLSFIHLFLLSVCTLTVSAQVGFGHAEKADDGWLFLLADDPDASQPTFDDASWRPVTLPHDWSIEGTPSQSLFSCTGYLPGGIAWYRKHFTWPSANANANAKADEKLYVCFDGVYNRSEVYLNGHLLGQRPNGYVSFVYDLTPYLREGDNVLAVRVDHSRQADSRWYTGSGIWRDVWFVSAPKVHLAQWGSTYSLVSLTDAEAVVDVATSVDADGKRPIGYNATFTLRDGSQVVATATAKATAKANAKVTARLVVPQPHRWSLADPHLYTLTVALERDGAVVDATTFRVGLRTLSFDADHGFALNGVPMKVKGVCVHHDAGVLGAAVPREVWQRRLLALKAMGANAVRCSHNPQNPDLYDLCDELGLLVMDEASDEWEFPKRKWLKGWNKGEPGYEGTYDFFAEWMERDLADMVRRDRNHPSIFLWSIGNEVDYPNDPYSHPVLDGTSISQPMYGGFKPDAPRAERIGDIAQRLSAIVRSLDTSRPVTGALAGVVMSNETAYPDAVDVVGYNYTEDRYVTDHVRYPSRVIYGSETGVGFEQWKAVRDNEHIFGQFIWTGFDYLGESGAWPSRGLGTGLIDFAGYPKPRGKFREALWSEQPMVYIGTYPERAPRGGQRQGQGQRPYLSAEAMDMWNYADGQSIRVVCYTNTPQARLLLNGTEVGPLQPYDDATGIITWLVPYAAGTLTAEGCDADGQPLCRYAIATTAAAPAALRVTLLDRTPTLAQILVEAVDSADQRVKMSRTSVTATVTGAARLLGLENAVNYDMTAPQAATKMLGQGRLVAYVALTPGAPATVTFTADGLTPVTVPLTAD